MYEQLSCGGRKGQRTHDNQLNNTAEVSNLVHIKGFQLSDALNLPGCSTHSRCSRMLFVEALFWAMILNNIINELYPSAPPSAARTRPWRVMTELRQDSQLERTSHSSNGAPASPVFESEDVLPVRMLSPIELSESKTFYPWRRTRPKNNGASRRKTLRVVLEQGVRACCTGKRDIRSFGPWASRIHSTSISGVHDRLVLNATPVRRAPLRRWGARGSSEGRPEW